MFESISLGPQQTFKRITEKPKAQLNRVKEQNKKQQSSENKDVYMNI